MPALVQDSSQPFGVRLSWNSSTPLPQMPHEPALEMAIRTTRMIIQSALSDGELCRIGTAYLYAFRRIYENVRHDYRISDQIRHPVGGDTYIIVPARNIKPEHIPSGYSAFEGLARELWPLPFSSSRSRKYLTSVPSGELFELSKDISL